MRSTTTAAATAKQILGFYDTIPAADQEAFAAGFVEMLSIYPYPVLDRAASPSRGLAAFVSFPNLAKFKELLDEWNAIYWEEQSRNRPKAIEQPVQRLLPGRIEDPPHGHFANVFVPENHSRYAALCEWAKTADPKWWKFGQSSDNRSGLWVPLNVWNEKSPSALAINDVVI